MDIKDLKDFTCKECGNDVFMPVTKFKIVSAFESETGQEYLQPIQVFVCTECGYLPEEFLML